MGRHSWHPFTVHNRTVSATPDEAKALARLWGTESCERCGRTIVLGERSMHSALDGRRTIICPDCFEPATATPTWTAAPARLSMTPVRLTDARTEESRAA